MNSFKKIVFAFVFLSKAVLASSGTFDWSNPGCLIFGTLNPMVTAVNANAGCLYQSSNGNLYEKQDNGTSTDWSSFALTNATFSTIGPFDSNAPSVNGLSSASSSLYAQSASLTVPGMVNTTAQSFAGIKTFAALINSVGINFSTDPVFVASTIVQVDSSGNTAFGPVNLANGLMATGTLPVTRGGTGQTSLNSTVFTTLFKTVATTLGDLVYGGAAGAPTRLAGDTSNVKKYITETSSGGVAAAPVFSSIALADLPTQPNNSFVGNFSGSTASPSISSITQLKTAIGIFTTSTSGLVPNNASGTGIAILHDDHTWSTKVQLDLFTGTAPTATVNANAGTGATCTVTGGTYAGNVVITAGTLSLASGDQCDLTFSTALTNAPYCQLQPTNATAAAMSVNVYKTSTNSALSVNFSIAATPVAVYSFDYLCAQNL